MIAYIDNGAVAVFRGQRYHIDSRTGYYQSGKIVDGKHKRLHVAVWEDAHGPAPQGMAIHHIDHDKRNNELDNLALVSASDHARHHAETRSDEQIEAARENMAERALPAACEWHGSPEGRAWHSLHAVQEWAGRTGYEYVCDHCGKTFVSRKAYSAGGNRFCSNACKTSYRRKSGVDNETRKCAACGAEFITNRFSKQKYCSHLCASRFRGKSRA